MQAHGVEFKNLSATAPVPEASDSEQLLVKDLIDPLLDKINSLPPDSRFILGITGYPGSGKSTLADYVTRGVNKALSQELAVIVPMDGYHFSNEVLEQRQLRELKGIPATFDGEGFVQLMTELRQTPPKTSYCPKFDRSIEASIPDAIEIRQDHKLLVIEGNYLLLKTPPWHHLHSLFDEVWFINVSIETILPRLIERHIAGGRTPEGAKQKVESTDLPNAYLVEGTRKDADRIVEFVLEGSAM